MSSQITTAFVQQYSANIQMLSQQMGSLLRDKVRLESIVGKNAFFYQVGKVTAVLKTSRHADTPQIDTPHARRRVSLADYEFADLIDQQDKVRLLIDPTSSYAQAAAMAMGRAMDDVVISAALGTAFTGETGSTSTVLPSTQKITESGTDGLTIAKLRTAKEKLQEIKETDGSIKNEVASSFSENISQKLKDLQIQATVLLAECLLFCLVQQVQRLRPYSAMQRL